MEPRIDQNEFRVLNYLDIFKSIVGDKAVGASSGLDADGVSASLAGIVSKGHATTSSQAGQQTWKITPQGESAVAAERSALLVQSGEQDRFNMKCEEFDGWNAKFKGLVTKWQVKDVFGTQTPNDHSDSEYDFGILDKLFSLHERVKHTLEEMDAILPACGFRNYVLRLDNAIEKIKEGSQEYLVKDEASYHNVWFELHESILKLWGRERVE